MSLTIVAGLTACSGSSQGTSADRADPAPVDTVADPIAVTDPASAVTGHQVMIGDSSALLWGDGPSGVVLVHGTVFDAASWQDQAVLIAAQDSTVVAVEDTSTGSIAAAVDYLRSEAAVDRMTLIGGSSGADAILSVEPYLTPPPDLLILLSPNRVVEGLGSEPKLIIASEDEVVSDVATDLAVASSGDDNTTLIVPGAAHAQNLFTSDQGAVVMAAILDQLARTG